MPCFHPLTAWRTKAGEIRLAKEIKDSYQLKLPCGGCLGCRLAQAKAWSLRCQLELQQHTLAAWTTLTYDDKHKPVTLQKRHLQLFLKKLRRRTATPVRFFASGEYGEQNQRPHYHAILYGIDQSAADRIEDAWTTSQGESLGFCRTTELSPATIAYTAGYCSKKIGYRKHVVEQVDPETGEVYQWQPPFIQMSRKPGIGGHARQWADSWRLYAIQQGHKMPVPRFLHEAWKAKATDEQLEDLLYEKAQLALTRNTTKASLQAAEKHAITLQEISADSRKY